MTSTRGRRVAGVFDFKPMRFKLGRRPLDRTGETAGRGIAEVEPGELDARGDPELGEDVAEMEVDRPGAQDELGRNLLVRRTGRDKPGDLDLLCRQLVEPAQVAAPGGDAAAPQFRACTLGPRASFELL